MNDLANGVVKGGELAAPLNKVQIKVYSGDKHLKQTFTTGDDGKWKLSNLSDNDHIIFSKKNYQDKTFTASSLPKIIRLIRNQLIGYQDKLWFKAGEKIAAYVHSDQPFQAHLYRHGFQKELIQKIGDFPSHLQMLPDDHFVAKGLGWKPTFSYTVPNHVPSGLYSLYLSSDEHEPFAIPFIISPDKNDWGNSPLLILASTNNWQSYNIWGGRSRYRNYEEVSTKDFMNEPGIFTEILQQVGQKLPPRLVSNIRGALGLEKKEPEWKFKRLSIRRPFSNCSLEDSTPLKPYTNHLAGGEWRVLAWLERENIDYQVISGYELHQQPEILDHYKGILLSTHCEYWTKKMYRSVKEFHQEHGLSIYNISGNTLYREIDFYEDGSHRCTSLKFKDSVEDETQLIGVRFSLADYGTCAPYKITKPSHWVFDDIPIHKRSETFGHLSLNQNTHKHSNRYDPGRPGVEFGLRGSGASGWETDKLSKNAPADFTVVARGQNPWGGAEMVVREPEGNRGAVFSVSSITFGGALLIDEVCSQIVHNALSKYVL